MSLSPRYGFGQRGRSLYGSRRSMALVTVLLMVVVISVTVIAFVVTMQLHRTASFSYSQSFKADQLAQGGAWWTVKELEEEIACLPTAADTKNGIALYTNFFATNMMPQYVGTNAAMVSLVKTSTAGTSAYVPGGSYPNGGVLPSSVSTATPSLNGRYVDAARWSEPCLGNFPSDDSADPSWILVTRSGPASVTNAGTQLPAFANTQDQAHYVIGRYAYAIYDEGGLIDINEAGYPQSFIDGSSMAASDLARKGSPGLMDLTAIPGWSDPVNQINKLIAWRNAGSAATMQSYTNYLYTTGLTATNGPAGSILQATNSFGTTNNYLYVAPGDNLFLSRQDLIAYANANSITNILPYVTTFSRDVNAPSFSPLTRYNYLAMRALNTPQAGGVSATISTTVPLDYLGKTNEYNPNIPLVRFANGNSLVSQRFPLSRLGLFNNPTANAGAISNYFGLTNNADGYSWSYSRSATTIAYLDQVATNISATAHSPDFFELLQAGILQGSLTPSRFNSTYTAWDANITATPSPYVASVTMQLGANVISQYTTNNWPIIINFNGESYTGNKSLPYLNEFLQWTYRPLHDVEGTTNRSDMMLVCPIEFWNPYQNSTNLPTAGPVNLRVYVEPVNTTNGSVGFYFDAQGVSTSGKTNMAAPYMSLGNAPTNTYVIPSALNYPVNTADGNKPYASFTNTTAFTDPALLTNVTSGSVNDWTNFTEGANSMSGFLAAYATNVPDARMVTSMSTNHATDYTYTLGGLADGGSAGFLVEFQDSGGNWHPYQGYAGTVAGLLTPINFTAAQGTMYYRDQSPTKASPYTPNPLTGGVLCFTNFNYFTVSVGFADPRAYTWGLAFQQATPGLSIRPYPTTAGGSRGRNGNYTAGFAYPYDTAGGSLTTPYNQYEGMLNENTNANPFALANLSWNTATNTYQYDVDGIIRPGDGALGTNANPFLATNATSFAARPIILNRPFRSVGEMGFAFRGQAPWKSINFFNGNSADAGLLDLFGNDVAPLVAGKINLNTRQPVTLQAALQGAYIAENPLTTLSSTQASNFASAIVSWTSATPATAAAGTAWNFNNRADLVRQFAQNAAFVNANGLSTVDSQVKSHRESVIRPLAEMGTTRTWNLLIDVVAQVGHYPPNAATANPGDLSKFVVEGERRYWLHVAIDRVTGQVVDEKLELYNE